jgi:hypothetical protein
MNSTPASPIVSIRFGNLDTFCEELAARGPNIEPVVRICQQVRPAHGQDGRSLPIEHVFGHASYLRRTADVLQIVALHLYLGQRWAYAEPTPDRAEVTARVDRLYDRLRECCQMLGYALVDGSAYQEPGTQLDAGYP